MERISSRVSEVSEAMSWLDAWSMRLNRLFLAHSLVRSPSCAIALFMWGFNFRSNIVLMSIYYHWWGGIIRLAMFVTLSVRAVTSAILVTGTTAKSYTPSSTTRLCADGGHLGGTACTSTSGKRIIRCYIWSGNHGNEAYHSFPLLYRGLPGRGRKSTLLAHVRVQTWVSKQQPNRSATWLEEMRHSKKIAGSVHHHEAQQPCQ